MVAMLLVLFLIFLLFFLLFLSFNLHMRVRFISISGSVFKGKSLRMDIELYKRTFPKTKFSPSTKHCLDKKNLFLKKSENSCFLPKAIICIFYK